MSLEGQDLGRYHLLRLIGSGGMGEVYLAQDPGVSRQVAIKVIRSGNTGSGTTASTDDDARLFLREARAIAKLDHPHILPLYDYGEEPTPGATFTYLVMPYRAEGSLESWLQQPATLSQLILQDIEQIARQAASALQHAHDHQIIHQDVKPSNFLLRSNPDNPGCPDLLLTDFGIAKLTGLTTKTSQSIRGTPAYMAPEQWAGHPLPATDQYALAIMLYELLTGHPPFQGNPMQMMYAHLHTQPQLPSSVNPRLPAALDAVIQRALNKNAQDRFPDISAFFSAFQQAIQTTDPRTLIRDPHTDIATFVKAPDTPRDLRATLAISAQEARQGGARTLTLPGGLKVAVAIPAGVVQGQVISVPLQNDPTGSSTVQRLHLTISIVSDGQAIGTLSSYGSEQTGSNDTETILTQRAGMIHNESANPGLVNRTPPSGKAPTDRGAPIQADEETLRADPLAYPPHNMPSASSRSSASFGADVATSARTPLSVGSSSDGGALPDGGARFTNPPAAHGEPPNSNRFPSRAKPMLLIGLVILVLLAGSGTFYAFAQARSGGHPAPGPSATVPAGSPSVPTQTATPDTNATATALAQTNATTTAQTNATATVTAQTNATATATAANANPYPPHSGTLMLDDPLSNNDQGHNWSVYTDPTTGNSCQFSNGAYDDVTVAHYGGPCLAQATDFSDFAYEIQMKFVRTGTSFAGGGIVFRSNGDRYYYFEIFESGKYTLNACIGNNCSNAVTENLSQSIPSFHVGLNQTNVIAVVAQGNNFTLYVNGERVAGPVSDSAATSSHGMIGVYGEGGDATTEIVYSDAKVWV